MVTRVVATQPPASPTTTTATTTTAAGASSHTTRQQEHIDGPDFRSILQHPPVVAIVEPIKDASWDAHKVYFNERESNALKKTKGDEFDEFFDSTNTSNVVARMSEKQDAEKQVLDRALEKMTQQQQVQANDDALDPLGWPRQQDGFETTALLLPPGVLLLNGNVNPAASFESDDGDDLNLIPYRPSDCYPEDDSQNINDIDDDALGEEAGIEIMCHGVNDALVLTPAPLVSKERRIQMYESRGVDEDSSVEDENAKEDEDWEEGRHVEYDSMKPARTEEEENDKDDDKDHSSENNMSIDKDDFKNKAKYQNIPSFDQSDKNNGDARQQPASFQAAADAANLAAASTTSPSAKKGFFKGLIGAGKNKNSISPKSQNKNKNDDATPVATAATHKPIPLLRPPPEDKLKQWEERQERAKMHLESNQPKNDN